MRYLVVVPTSSSGEVRFEDLEVSAALATGDVVLIDALRLRVRDAVSVAEDGYDGTLICTPDE